MWQEAGTNFGVTNDNDPYQNPGGTNQNTSNHLGGLLQTAGVSWKSYPEDIDLPINKGAVLPKRGNVNLRGWQFSGGVDLLDSIHELTIPLPTGSDHRRGRPTFSRNGHG